MTTGQPLEVRSYRSVFELERRIYRLDRFRLNPSGVPLRGVAYVAVSGLAVALATRLPVAGWALAALPWYLHWVGLPVGAGGLLALVRVDGRPFHLGARALGAWLIASRRLAGLHRTSRPGTRWHPGTLTVIPDGSEPEFRSFRYRGPGAVMLGRPHRARAGRHLARGAADVYVSPAGRARTRPRVLGVGQATVLEVRARKDWRR